MSRQARSGVRRAGAPRSAITAFGKRLRRSARRALGAVPVGAHRGPPDIERSRRRIEASGLFDAAFYLRENEDVRASGMDPLEHFLRHGQGEGRAPSARFDTGRYVRETLGGRRCAAPLEHFLTDCSASGTDPALALEAMFPQAPLDLAASIRHFANPGPAYEEADDAAAAIALSGARARTIAFYLPQFHAFAENDAWWGKGFTEWRNVARGTPRFAGHYQPRIPRDLGFYDLDDGRVMHEQARMAARAGIEAFCFYYYWFDGKRLMERPLDRFIAEGVDRDFCIMWANENWTRTWDGAERDVLIEQRYRDRDEAAFIADTASYMAQPRYVQVAGRPLFILYRPGLLPEPRETLARWRRLWTEALGVEPWITMVQGFGDVDPREYGLDAAVEFPPHKLVTDIPEARERMTVLDPAFTGSVRPYADVVERALGEPVPDYPLLKTVVPSWDNDSRREGRGLTLHGSTPARYERWLSGAIEHARAHPLGGESLVFINAWNEWAEGAYLEPDVHYGHAYLNATRRAVFGLERTRTEGQRERLLLVGHDAHPHGAQMLLLNLAQTFSAQFGVAVTVVLKSDGPLLERYREHVRTLLLEEIGGGEGLGDFAAAEGIDIAICNTSVTGDLTAPLERAGVRVVSLIHELPTLIEEYGLEDHLHAVSRHAEHVVFASELVENGFREFARGGRVTTVVRPQGTYSPVRFDAEARARCRAELGIGADARVVLNAGYADLRKGFDLFMHTARRMIRARPDMHFVWVGKLDPELERWVRGADEARIHFTGFVEDVAAWYSASDALYLCSREDPYPTVALEAMEAGLPVIVHAGATGLERLLQTHGQVVDGDDVAAIDAALSQAVDEDDPARRQARVDHVATHCRFDDYAFSLLELLRPSLSRVSVVVPNYEYERYLPSRLESVFAQSAPVFEVIVLDDGSSDDSVATIERAAEAAGRRIRLVTNEANGGSVFAQWRKGAGMARGEHLWIAEADDLADPRFLERSLDAFDADTVFSFSDSAQIGTDGELLAPSYDYYYRLVDDALFEADAALDGAEFVRRALAERNVILNVSAVLWQRSTLVQVLEKVGPSLEALKLVGDWRLYLEALARPGARIAYLAESLNVHRRHPSSVTHSIDVGLHLVEIEAMQAHARRVFGTDAALDARIAAYVLELRAQFGLEPLAGEVARAA